MSKTLVRLLAVNGDCRVLSVQYFRWPRFVQILALYDRTWLILWILQILCHFLVWVINPQALQRSLWVRFTRRLQVEGSSILVNLRFAIEILLVKISVLLSKWCLWRIFLMLIGHLTDGVVKTRRWEDVVALLFILVRVILSSRILQGWALMIRVWSWHQGTLSLLWRRGWPLKILLWMSISQVSRFNFLQLVTDLVGQNFYGMLVHELRILTDKIKSYLSGLLTFKHIDHFSLISHLNIYLKNGSFLLKSFILLLKTRTLEVVFLNVLLLVWRTQFVRIKLIFVQIILIFLTCFFWRSWIVS